MIPLYINNGVAYVWNSEDWYKIRSNHHICGALIGTLVSHPRQNDFSGLPMALLSEEAALLVEKGVCELLSLPNLTEDLSYYQKRKVLEIENRIADEQHEAFKVKRINEITKKIDVIVAGKEKKLKLKGKVDVKIDKQTLLEEEIKNIKKQKHGIMLMHIPTEHVIETEIVKLQIEALIPSVLSGEGATRYAIFKDLWNKGYHVTSGSKFGSDYLVYPGDPVKFHASYMLRCVSDVKQSLRPANLVSFGRLSVCVNKLAVFAFVNAHGEIEYQTLEWHNI